LTRRLSQQGVCFLQQTTIFERYHTVAPGPAPKRHDRIENEPRPWGKNMSEIVARLLLIFACALIVITLTGRFGNTNPERIPIMHAHSPHGGRVANIPSP
jgi:hypothetical protein